MKNRFQDFFEDDRYLLLKNDLYNYRLRRSAVRRQAGPGLTLEVGSGISPMITGTPEVVYSDLSVSALQVLRKNQGAGCYVAADAAALPFKAEIFSRVVCSEVIEHLPDDRAALAEFRRVSTPSGRLVVTFPHRRAYFTIDDRAVGHFRRYELTEMTELLNRVGYRPLHVEPVLGPLEKLSMIGVFWMMSLRGAGKGAPSGRGLLLSGFSWISRIFRWTNLVFSYLAAWDARLMPASFAAVLLICAEKRRSLP